jgi:acyl carrier protein
MSKEIELSLRAIIGEVIDNLEDANMIGLEDDLGEIGLNSVSFIKVVVKIEAKFCLEFDDNNLGFNNFENLQALIQYLENKLQLLKN